MSKIIVLIPELFYYMKHFNTTLIMLLKGALNSNIIHSLSIFGKYLIA